MKQFIKILTVFIYFLVFLIIPKPAFAENLLSNSGFEDGLSSWTLNGATAIFSAISDSKHEGSIAAKLSKENAASWAYLYQRISIEANNLSKVMIGTGLILMISCGILTFLKWKKYL